MWKLTTSVILASLFSPATARANDDGFYCIGRGYLAFETRVSQRPTKHLLHIVQFSDARGIVSLPPVPLEDVQVHAMRCDTTTVELEAWTTGYSVDISNPDRPLITSRPIDRKRPPTPTPKLQSRDTVIDLEGGAFAGEFQLIISRVSRRYEGGFEHFAFTHLIRREPGRVGARILSSATLFEDVRLETID